MKYIKSVASLQNLLNGINSQVINKDMCNKISAQIKEIQKQLKKCNEYKSSLYENYVSGILNKDDYKVLKETYTDDGKRLEAALSELETELVECMNNTSQKTLWIEHFKQFENISEIDRNIVIQLIMSIHIYDKTHLQITFNYKDEYEQAVAALETFKEAV